MRTDEKIALLDRMRRMKQQEEEEVVVEQEVEKKKWTLEEALEGIHHKKVELEEGTILEFETQTYFKEEVPFVMFKNFYQASKREEMGLILVNHDKNISQIMSWNQEARKAKTLNQWANLLVNGMAANRMYAQIKKKVTLDFVEYICFEVPAKGTKVWNLMFRFKEQWFGFVGNYNCMIEDADTYGIFLEAMVVELDQWIGKQKGADKDGTGCDNL